MGFNEEESEEEKGGEEKGGEEKKRKSGKRREKGGRGYRKDQMFACQRHIHKQTSNIQAAKQSMTLCSIGFTIAQEHGMG